MLSTEIRILSNKIILAEMIDEISRRDFLKKAGAVAATAMVGSLAGWSQAFAKGIQNDPVAAQFKDHPGQEFTLNHSDAMPGRVHKIIHTKKMDHISPSFKLILLASHRDGTTNYLAFVADCTGHTDGIETRHRKALIAFGLNFGNFADQVQSRFPKINIDSFEPMKPDSLEYQVSKRAC